MDNNQAPKGIRPLRHEPNRLWPWVFRQHQVWVDINGSEHEIESMPRDYVEHVIRFCFRRAVWIYVLVELDGGLLERVVYEDGRLVIPDFASWLEETPLMRALRRRLQR